MRTLRRENFTHTHTLTALNWWFRVGPRGNGAPHPFNLKKLSQISEMAHLRLGVATILVVVAQSWSPLACPRPDSSFEPSCTSQALPTDAALTLFFQIESTGSSGGYFACSSASVTYCARNWTQPESGSVGSCFFLLVRSIDL